MKRKIQKLLILLIVFIQVFSINFEVHADAYSEEFVIADVTSNFYYGTCDLNRKPTTITVIQNNYGDTYLKFKCLYISNKIYPYSYSIPVKGQYLQFDDGTKLTSPPYYFQSNDGIGPVGESYYYLPKSFAGKTLTSVNNPEYGNNLMFMIYCTNGNSGFCYFSLAKRLYIDPSWFNSAPIIDAISPVTDAVYSLNSGYNTISLMGTVSDADTGNVLTIKYNIDGGAEQIIPEKITTSGSFTNNISVADLTEGTHNINVWSVDNRNYKSTVETIPFKIDQTAPSINQITISSTATSITVSGTATDTVAGLHEYPYRYTVGANLPTSWIADTSYTQSGLDSNTQYSATLEVKDAVGNIASTTKSAYTNAAIPSVSVNNATSYSLNINNSDNNPTNTQYQISVNDGVQYITPEGTLTTSPVWITLPSKNITVTGLNPSTTYTFTAKAKNAEDIETAWSAPVSGTTLVQPPNAPVNMTAVATSNSISVVWDPVAGSSGYDMEVDGTIIDNSTYTSYSHTNLTPYTQHTYRVRAKNEGGTGAWSELMSKYTQQDTPNTPFNIDAAATNTSIIVTWQPIPGATGYDIEVDGEVVNNSSSTNYVHTGLLSGTMHGYRVRSINSGGKSEWSNEVLVSTLTDAPIVPSNITATPGSGQITVAWDVIPGATYEIEVDGNIKDNGTSNTYIHSNIEAGSIHSYRIRTNKSGSLSDWSTVVTAEIPIEEFGTPKNIKAEATDTTVTMSWSPVVDATGYEIEVDGVVLDNGTETACVFNSLTSNTQYIYRVRAKGTDKVSDWSEPIAVTTYALSTPKNIASSVIETSIGLTWDAITGATSYEIDIDGQLVEVTTNTYTHESLTPNTQHSYRIRAKSASGTSAWSTQILKSTMSNELNAIDNIITKSRKSSITLVWKPLENVSVYEVEIDGATIQNVIGTSYLHDNLLAGMTHTYRVRPFSETGSYYWSDVIQATTLPDALQVPSNIVVSSTTNSVLITWDKVDNATEYELEVDGTVINVGIGTSYLHKNLTPETQHTYRVRAKNISSSGEWSSSFVTTTKNSQISYDISTEVGEVFNLAIISKSIENPTQYTYTITYNPDELELLDLCSFTSRIDLGTGNIIGTDIQVVQFEPGTKVFKKLGTTNGQAWNGFINSIKFRSKIDGVSNISYRYE